MREYVTEAIVLGRRPYRERDWIVDLLTDSFGPVAARVVGGARPLSKLSPHFDAGSHVLARLVKASRFTVTDVVTIERFPAIRRDAVLFARALELLALVRRLAAPHVPDAGLWQHLVESFERGAVPTAQVLALLGHDPAGSRCGSCGAAPATTFVYSEHELFCNSCTRPFPFSDLARVIG